MSDTQGPGVGPYKGYEFQIQASVYLALELMFRLGWTDVFTIEPIGGEDIETKIEAAEKPAWITATGSVPLLIQIKSRGTGHWTAGAFKRVMEGKDEAAKAKGPARRERPAATLSADSRSRFLFLTDAQLEAKVQSLRVATLTPEAAPGSASAAGVPLKLAGRVLVLERLTTQTLKLLTANVLRDHLHVPKALASNAIDALLDEVRTRLLADDTAERDWTKAEVVAVVERFGGHPSLASRPLLVPPTNYNDLAAHLTTQHALLLDGPPGTGKTCVARELALAYVPQGYQLLREDTTPSAVLKAMESPDRLVFLIEDPWGSYRRAADADRWAAELPKLIGRASDAKKIVITSRVGIRDMVYPGGLPIALASSEQRLDESHYPPELRLRILSAESAKLDGWQRDLLVGRENYVVGKLSVPLSLQVFTQYLAQAKANQQPPSLDKLIARSNVEAIAGALADEIGGMGRGAVGAAVALWALLMAGPALTEDVVAEVRNTLSEGGLTWIADVDSRSMLEWLVRTRMATWRDDGRLEMHPTRLEGLDLLVSRHPAWADDTLRALLSGLVKIRGGGAAAAIIKRLRGRRLAVSVKVQAAMNIHLLDRVNSAQGHDAASAFDDLASLAEGSDPAVMLAKSLIGTDEPGPPYAFSAWKVPTLTPMDVAAISSSPLARRVADVFVSEVLPRGDPIYRWRDLGPFLRQFRWDLSSQFLSTAVSAIEDGRMEVGLLVEAALDTEVGTPPYSEITAAALTAHRAAEKWWTDSVEDNRKAMQGELDAGYSSFIADEPSDRFAPARWAFEALVQIRRRREGYGWITGDDASAHLLVPWTEAIDGDASDAEWDTLRELCGTAHRQELWKATARTGRRRALSWLLDALPMEPYNNLPAWADALLAVANGNELLRAIEPVAASLSPARRLAVASALLHHSPDAKGGEEVVESINHLLLSTDESAALAFCRRDPAVPGGPKMSDSIACVLQAVAKDPPHPAAIEALNALAMSGHDIGTALPAFIASDDAQRRSAVMELAAIQESDSLRELIRRAVTNDDDHDCRRAAMWALAHKASDADRKLIIGRWEDPSAPVRRDCARLIGRGRWESGLPALLQLVQDTRDFSHGRIYRGGPVHEVARAAGQSLARLGGLPREAVSDLLSLLKRPGKQSDVAVRYYVVDALASEMDDRLVPIFLRLLSSRARMDGHKREGFPLRYAAAWALVQQFSDPNRRTEGAVAPLAQAAVHPDERLAAPALIAIALLGTAAIPYMGGVLAKTPLGESAAAIVLGTAAWAGLPAPDVADAAVRSDHAIRIITDYASGTGPTDDTKWTAWLDTRPVVRHWLEQINTSDEANPYLRFVIFQMFGGRATTSLHWDDYRGRDLAESMPVMTLWSMAGGT